MRAKEFTEGYYNQKPGSTVSVGDKDYHMPKSLGAGPSHSMSDNDRNNFDSQLKSFLGVPGGYDPADKLDPRNIIPGKIREVIMKPEDMDDKTPAPPEPNADPKPTLGTPEIDDMHKQAYAARKSRY